MALLQQNAWTWDSKLEDWYREVKGLNGQAYRSYAKSQSSASSAAPTSSVGTTAVSRNIATPQYTGLSAPKHGSPGSSGKDMNIADAQTVFKETNGEFENLDPSYRKIDPKLQWDFWKPGRVFKTLWWEPQGNGAVPSGPSEVRYGETAYAKVYRFIVIRAKTGESWSNCIRISTYGGQACTKKGLDQKHHTIVYTGTQAPQKLAGEKKMNKDPVRIVPVDDSEKLDPLSRVNLAKTYPVEHNVKVKVVGNVSPTELKKLQGYWKNSTVG